MIIFTAAVKSTRRNKHFIVNREMLDNHENIEKELEKVLNENIEDVLIFLSDRVHRNICFEGSGIFNHFNWVYLSSIVIEVNRILNRLVRLTF